ncbi:hypothetical protein EYC84_005993 [Monilinia fructicola]|uniref:Uncharacterized protein n=1 Tax=Monilinia fructicola TaxID=38448 RepID=A0A5M9JZ82_MONFR|nr:hypothetical protein EYC84_005993 [Monilinia fructicola]
MSTPRVTSLGVIRFFVLEGNKATPNVDSSGRIDDLHQGHLRISVINSSSFQVRTICQIYIWRIQRQSRR